jgi:hypothetical protein
MTNELALADALARTRTDLVRTGGAAADFADVTFTGAEELAGWLRDCADKVRRQDFVLRSMEDSPDTLYLSLIDVSFNFESWYVAPLGFAWEGRGEDIELDELFDGVVGHEAGDVGAHNFTFTGLERLQEAMAESDDNDVAGRFVVLAAMGLVDHALRLAGDLGVRVALSRSNEPLIGLWVHDGGTWRATVHADGVDD